MKKKGPRILFFDIETSPNLSYTWAKWQQDVIAFKQEWYIMSVAWKWEGGTVRSLCLGDINSDSDKLLCVQLYNLFEEADIVCAHNGDAFDIKKAKARFIYHGMKPPKQIVSIDTKKIAKSQFSFNSNSLDDLGRYLGVGRKMQHEGFSLWLKCMGGDKKAWRKMSAYNRTDVELLERVYNKLKPWAPNHPSLARLLDRDGCPNCGSDKIKSDGFRVTKVRKYRRLMCLDCFARFQGGISK